MKNYLIAGIAVALSACGGGGGGGTTDAPVIETPSQPPSNPGGTPVATGGFLSFDRTRLTLQGFSDEQAPPRAKFKVTTRDAVNQQVSAYIVSSGLGVTEVLVNRLDAKNYDVEVIFKNNLPAGEHSGYLDINICQDATAACTQPYGSEPSRLAYTIKVSPASNIKPLTKFADITWSGPNGDSSNSQYVDAAVDVGGITQRWNYALPNNDGRGGFNQVRVAGGRVFVLSADIAPWGTFIGSTLRAIDENSGQLVWESKFDDYLNKFAIDQEEIVITDEKKEAVYRLNAATGDRKVIELKISQSPFTHVESVEPYVDGYLAANRPESPNSWNAPHRYNSIIYKATNGVGWISSSYYTLLEKQSDSPNTFLTTNSTIYTKVLDKNDEYGVLALSAKDGTQKFIARVDGFASRAPLFLMGDSVCSTDHLLKISCFDKVTGKATWSAAESGFMFAASPQSLLVSNGEYATWRSAKTGEVEFTWGVPNSAGSPKNSSNDVLMFKDVVFIGSTWNLVAVRKGTKEAIWTYSRPGGELAVSENGVLFTISGNRLVAFNLR